MQRQKEIHICIVWLNQQSLAKIPIILPDSTLRRSHGKKARGRALQPVLCVGDEKNVIEAV